MNSLKKQSAPNPRVADQRSHFQHLLADIALWVGIVLFLQAFRAVLLLLFRNQIGLDVGSQQLLRCFVVGLRFDASIATYICLPLVVFSVAGFCLSVKKIHSRARQVVIGFTAVLLAFIFPTDIAYFREYHNQFDHWILGLVFDDRRAIALTIWKSYPVVWLTLGVIALAVGLGFLLSRWTAWVSRQRMVSQGFSQYNWRVFAVAVFLTAVVFGLRGGFGRRPVQLKDAAVCGDFFLDKIVLNPLSALRYAIKQHFTLSQEVGLETILPGGDIHAAVRVLDPYSKRGAIVDDYLKRVATGTHNKKPQHIFLVVMESYDAWAMQPKFRSLHLTDRLMALGRAGIMAEGFVSAGSGTMPSLAALICGLPEVGLNVNYRASVRAGVPTAAAPIFKRMGYRTRFFYGGYPSWQRLGEFCREQGFDEVYGGAAMSDRLTGNEWGVDDGVLFRFILEKTGDEPSFNIVMTTSYHPPYSVDVAAEGFSIKALPSELSHYRANAEALRVFGHLWYSDRCIGDFADALIHKQPRSLLAITGDHWSRRCLEPRPSIFERKAVPMVFYAPEILSVLTHPPASLARTMIFCQH